MTIIELNKKLYTVPTDWNELTGRQLIRIMKVLHTGTKPWVSLLKLLKILLNISWFQFFRCKSDQLEEFVYLTTFIFNENHLYKNVLPKYKNFYGPADDFNNLVMAEFVFTQSFYLRYFDSKKKDIEALDNLVACLYRPEKRHYNLRLNPDGDIREPFNENVCLYNAKHKISKWPMEVKQAILFWYDGCHARIVKDLPTQSSGEPAKYGLLSIMRAIADKGVHGDFQKVEKMFVRMWLMEMHEMTDEVERIKKMNK